MNQNTAEKLEEAVTKELSGPSTNSGFRTIWWRLAVSGGDWRRYYGVFVPRDAVMYTTKQIDPDGSNNPRARKVKRREYRNAGANSWEYRNAGANSCWHVDGYDKLKPIWFPSSWMHRRLQP